jgi:hypothetical protein
MVRDLINGSISGGIAVSSASFYITNPVWSMLIGGVSGLVQPVINYF